MLHKTDILDQHLTRGDLITLKLGYSEGSLRDVVFIEVNEDFIVVHEVKKTRHLFKKSTERILTHIVKLWDVKDIINSRVS